MQPRFVKYAKGDSFYFAGPNYLCLLKEEKYSFIIYISTDVNLILFNSRAIKFTILNRFIQSPSC